MGDAAVMNAGSHTASAQTQDGGPSWGQMPLPFLKAGQPARIVRVRGKEELQRHLATMGFVPGASVKVVSQVSGNAIVEVKGTQVALSQQVASHIVVAL